MFSRQRRLLTLLLPGQIRERICRALCDQRHLSTIVYSAISASSLILNVWDVNARRVLRTLEGHSSPVHGVAVTPDGKRAVSASHDGILKVWDVDTGYELRTLEGHSSPVHGVAVTPDGKRAVSASDDRKLIVWNADTGRILRTLEGHSRSVLARRLHRTGSGQFLPLRMRR